MHAPVFLDYSCCKDWAFVALEKQRWDPYPAANLIFVDDAFKKLLFRVLSQVGRIIVLSQLSYFSALDVT